MKTTKWMLLLLASAGAAGAQASDALAAKHACVACHQAEKKTVGPAWKDIATQYADGGVTAAKLAESIKRGSSGKWGPVPMPAQSALSDADAQTLGAWILARGAAKP